MIRPIVPSDYRGMLYILQRGPRSRYKIRNIQLIGEPNDDKWAKFFMKLGSTTIGWVKVDETGKVVGVALGMVVDNFWDSKILGRILLWYVEPEYRGIPAIRLMQKVIQWLRDQGVDYMISACDFNSEAGRAYRKLGFKPLEETLYLVGG